MSDYEKVNENVDIKIKDKVDIKIQEALDYIQSIDRFENIEFEFNVDRSDPESSFNNLFIEAKFGQHNFEFYISDYESDLKILDKEIVDTFITYFNDDLLADGQLVTNLIDFDHEEENPHYNSEGEFLCNKEIPICKKCNALARIWQLNPKHWNFRKYAWTNDVQYYFDGIHHGDTHIIVVRYNDPTSAVIQEPEKVIIMKDGIPFTFEKHNLHPEIMKRVKQLLFIAQVDNLSYPKNNERWYGMDKKLFYARWWGNDNKFPRPHYRNDK